MGANSVGSVSLMSQELWSPGSGDTDGLKGTYTHWNAGFSLVLKWEPQPPNRIKVLCYSRPQNTVLSLLSYLFMFPWASPVAQLVKNRLQCRRPWFKSWVRKIRWRRNGLPTPVFLGFPCGSAGKESACNVGDLGSIPGLGRSPGEGKAYPPSPSILA